MGNSFARTTSRSEGLSVYLKSAEDAGPDNSAMHFVRDIDITICRQTPDLYTADEYSKMEGTLACLKIRSRHLDAKLS